MVELAGDDYFVFASDDGVYEPLHDLGDVVTRGEPAARIWFPDDPARQPIVVRFRHDGLVICQRSIGRTSRGDCLYHLATDISL
jgi:predicted deacylase